MLGHARERAPGRSGEPCAAGVGSLAGQSGPPVRVRSGRRGRPALVPFWRRPRRPGAPEPADWQWWQHHWHL